MRKCEYTYVCIHAHTQRERKKNLLFLSVLKQKDYWTKLHELVSIRYKSEKADMGFKSSPKFLNMVWLWSSAGWRSMLCDYDNCAELEDQE